MLYSEQKNKLITISCWKSLFGFGHFDFLVIQKQTNIAKLKHRKPIKPNTNKSIVKLEKSFI